MFPSRITKRCFHFLGRSRDASLRSLHANTVTFSKMQSQNEAELQLDLHSNNNGSHDNDDNGNAKVVELYSWGRGSAGQLGGGVEETRIYPGRILSMRMPVRMPLEFAPMQGLLPASASAEAAGVELGISCGLFHSALLVNGNVYVWGKGDGGRLGLGSEQSVYKPVLNPFLQRVRSIALGGLHSVAVTADGDAFSWGYGGFGALGHSAYNRELSPKKVMNHWKGKLTYIATSGAHTAAITDSGEVYTWGRDEGEGRLGLGSEGGPDEGACGTPSKVEMMPVPVIGASCGGFFTLALTCDGQVWSWGGNANGELGRGTACSDWVPRPIPSLEAVHIVQIVTGGYHSLALTDDGKVLTWGHGGQGQLGHSFPHNVKSPQLVEALADERVVYVACGSLSSAAVTDTGKLYMWGKGGDSQLGVPGLPDIQPSPVSVNFLVESEELGPAHVHAVAAGASHAICLVSRSSN